MGDVARVVVAADRQGQVVEGVDGVTAGCPKQGLPGGRQHALVATPDSNCRLPLSLAIVRARRRASYAATGSASR